MSQIYTFSEDRCAMCGVIIPEGRMVCPKCEKKARARISTSQTVLCKKIAWQKRIQKKNHKCISESFSVAVPFLAIAALLFLNP